MKKYILLTIAIIVLAGGSYVAERSFLASSAATPAFVETVSNESSEVKPQSQQPALTPQRRIAATTNTPKAVSSPSPNVTLSAAGSSYTAFAPTGSTVIDTMRVLASTTNFSFSGKDYPSLGFFVDSINGKKAEDGHNWILYVNGTLSGTGASQTTLKAGDAIEWRYEKNY